MPTLPMLEKAPRLIGLTGPNGAGKDTVARMMLDCYHLSRRRAASSAFADALYTEVGLAFDISTTILKHRATKEQPMDALRLSRCFDAQFVHCMLQTRRPITADNSPRQILQWWGTEYRRAQQTDYWVQRLLQHMQTLQAQGVLHIVITDVRFADEAAAIRAQGGQIWRIDRPHHTPVSTGHVSEVTGQEFSPETTILNNGSLDKLRVQTLQALCNACHVSARTHNAAI